MCCFNKISCTFFFGGGALYFIMEPFKKLILGPLACQTDIAFKIITQNWNCWTYILVYYYSYGRIHQVCLMLARFFFNAAVITYSKHNFTICLFKFYEPYFIQLKKCLVMIWTSQTSVFKLESPFLLQNN